MNEAELERAFSEKKRLSVAEAQKIFSAGYGETRRAFYELEKKSIIGFLGGVDFICCASQKGRGKSKTDTEDGKNELAKRQEDRLRMISSIKESLKRKNDLYRTALSQCAELGIISKMLLRLELKVNYSVASEIYDWLIGMKIITEKNDYMAKVLLTEEEIEEILTA